MKAFDLDGSAGRHFTRPEFATSVILPNNDLSWSARGGLLLLP